MISTARLPTTPGVWPRENRVLALTLVGSVCVHVAAIALSPRLRHGDETPPRPLEVVIEKPPPRAEVKPPPPPVAKPPPPVVKPPTPRVVQQELRPKAPPPPVAEQ